MSAITLQDIRVYPIKSTAGISLSNSWVDHIGLPFDRRFVVCGLNGQFITARTKHELCLIQCHITANGFILTAPNMPPLSLEYSQCRDQYLPVTVWSDTINAQHCHESVDSWFSQYLNQPCQLLYFGEQSTRQVKNTDNPLAFADGYPLLLISRASLNELNSRLAKPVNMRQFRPNLIIENSEPFEEDTWQRIIIGDVEFELTKPCSRCIFTTVNPDKGEKHATREPLATLQSYRQVEGGDVMFGQNVIPIKKGHIKQGDAVSIVSTKSAPVFVNATHKAKTATHIEKTAAKAVNESAELPDKLTLTCTKVIDETHDVKTFVFTNPKGKVFNYHAGQHLPITFEINGAETHAVYTLSSSPTRSHYLSMTVKRVENGKVSNYLHDHFHVGHTLIAKKPSGAFHIANIDTRKLLLLSAGSGVTPMLSMLKSLTDKATNNDIVFFHSARSEQDIIAKEEVAGLAKQHGNCQVSYTLTQSAKPSWQDYQGHLNEQMLKNIPDLTSREVMVCGPEGFRESAKNLLLSLGLPEKQFHFESFGVRKKPVEQPEIAEVKPKKVNILFDAWDTHVKGNNQETLLEQGEAAGLILPYSCRGGMCGACKVKLESGEVEQLAEDGLMQEEKELGYILSCSCIPKTDVVINKA